MDTTKKQYSMPIKDRLKLFFTKRKIRIYALSYCDDLNDILYFANSKKEIYQVLDKMLFNKNISHFLLWCDLHEFAEGDRSHGSTAWKQYCETRAEEFNEFFSNFVVRIIYYPQDSFASILRMFCNIQPMMLSFESPEEVQYYDSQKGDLKEVEGLMKQLEDSPLKTELEKFIQENMPGYFSKKDKTKGK